MDRADTSATNICRVMLDFNDTIAVTPNNRLNKLVPAYTYWSPCIKTFHGMDRGISTGYSSPVIFVSKKIHYVIVTMVIYSQFQ
jgi:hypothetical protein